MSKLKCPFCKEEIISDLCFTFNKKDRDYTDGRQIYKCNKCGLFGKKELWQGLIRTHKALDKGMEHITGLNNMIESWYKLLQSDKDASTKYAILKSAISAYVENKGGNNE